MLTSESIIIGVSGDSLLQKKAYCEFLENFDLREKRVREFISEVNPKLNVVTFELKDPVGVAGTDRSIEACILTREVEKGITLCDNQ